MWWYEHCWLYLARYNLNVHSQLSVVSLLFCLYEICRIKCASQHLGRSRVINAFLTFWRPDSPVGLELIRNIPEPNQRWHSLFFFLAFLHWLSFKSRIHFKTPLITFEFLIWHGTFFCLWLVNSSTPWLCGLDPPTIHNFKVKAPVISQLSTYWRVI